MISPLIQLPDGQWQPLRDGVTTIGRGKGCVLRLQEPTISKRHVELHVGDGEAWIHNVSSGKPLVVDGEPVESEQLLEHGARIVFGGVELRFASGTQPLPGSPEAEAERTSPGKLSKEQQIWLSVAIAVVGAITVIVFLKASFGERPDPSQQAPVVVRTSQSSSGPPPRPKRRPPTAAELAALDAETLAQLGRELDEVLASESPNALTRQRLTGLASRLDYLGESEAVIAFRQRLAAEQQALAARAESALAGRERLRKTLLTLAELLDGEDKPSIEALATAEGAARAMIAELSPAAVGDGKLRALIREGEVLLGRADARLAGLAHDAKGDRAAQLELLLEVVEGMQLDGRASDARSLLAQLETRAQALQRSLKRPEARVERLMAAIAAAKSRLTEAAPPLPQAKIKAAIRKGREALLRMQRDDGSWRCAWAKDRVGPTALGLLAALESGAPAKGDGVKRALAHIWSQPAPRRSYSAGLLVMALRALAGRRGGLGKQPRAGARSRLDSRAKLSKREGRAVEEAFRLLVSSRRGGGWSYTLTETPPTSTSGWDHSNTQYAILGLRAASRLGLRDLPTWKAVLAHLLEQQKQRPRRPPIPTPKGRWLPPTPRGWAYTTRSETQTMTCVGCASLVIAVEQLALHGAPLDETERKRCYHAVRDGMAWVGERVRAPLVREEKIDGYWLYGLERAGVLTRRQYIGRVDWYRQGAADLLAAQRPDGSWDGTRGSHVETAFALLFLVKATLPTEVVISSGGLLD